MTIRARDADEARALAQTLLEGVRRDAPRLLTWDGVELAGALEQRLFLALRDGSTAAEPGWAAGAEVAVSLAGSVLAANRLLDAHPAAIVLDGDAGIDIDSMADLARARRAFRNRRA